MLRGGGRGKLEGSIKNGQWHSLSQSYWHFLNGDFFDIFPGALPTVYACH